MKHKAFKLASFKALDAAQGIFEALVAVFNNVDRAGDKIIPGAFAKSLANWQTKGRPIPVIFSHEWDNLDAHIGQVLEAKETDEGLYVKGQLEMDEPFAARVWKKMTKGTLAEFSFAYNVVDSVLVKENDQYVNELRELELLEVGPCLVGMNPETQLLGVKKAIASHSTPTSDAAWDGPGNEARVRSGEDASYYRRIYAWQDAEGDPSVKSTWKFIHHEVDADGNPGAANMRACSATIAILNGGRGVDPSAQPWGVDREGIHAHIARHMRDGDMEPPPLKSLDEASKAFKEGRRNSAADLERIQRIHDLTCELGAKCVAEAESEGANEGEAQKGKPSEASPSTLAMRVALELMELGVS